MDKTPRNRTTNIPPLTNTKTFEDSLAHLLNRRNASADDTVMFLLHLDSFGEKAARALAEYHKWNIDSTLLPG